MKPWLILKRDYGQLGNRLHTHANALSYAIEHDLNLLNLSFIGFASHFLPHKGLSIDRHLPHASLFHHLLRLPQVISLLQRLALSDRHLAKLANNLYIVQREDHETLEETELDRTLSSYHKPPRVLIRAWDLRCQQSLQKHAPEIRRRLTPTKATCDAVTHLLSSLPRHDMLVGLHARRGDYALWQDGLHYHSWEQYAEWLHQTHAVLLRNGNHPTYLLCSDELPPADTFSPLPVAIEQRPIMTDLHALSSCQLLLGPPSSFSSWAAFYGKVPHLCLKPNLRITTLPKPSNGTP